MRTKENCSKARIEETEEKKTKARRAPSLPFGSIFHEPLSFPAFFLFPTALEEREGGYAEFSRRFFHEDIPPYTAIPSPTKSFPKNKWRILPTGKEKFLRLPLPKSYKIYFRILPARLCRLCGALIVI